MNEPDIPSINEGIACKFRKIEVRLARRRSAVGLFEALLADIQREFCIPFVWLSLILIPELAGLQKSMERSPLLRDCLKIIEQAAFLELVPDGVTPLLVTGDLRPFFRLLPPSRKYFIRSLAISPLTLRGRLIGSLNQGDPSLERYEPGMDTTLLMHLAQSVSHRLTHLLSIEQLSRYRHEP
jgi:uncharacterized protein YigA (DUF484 family)